MVCITAYYILKVWNSRPHRLETQDCSYGDVLMYHKAVYTDFAQGLGDEIGKLN